ncbi:hypothetical protein [Gluconacetobacter tumulisoli]|nr:hypothetical protein [Gluconacetobacter tumulisoli]
MAMGTGRAAMTPVTARRGRRALMLLPLAGLLLLAACGPDYGDRGTRTFRGDGYGNVGYARGSYGFEGHGY